MQKILFPDNIKPGGTRKFWNLIFKNILGQPANTCKGKKIFLFKKKAFYLMQ